MVLSSSNTKKFLICSQQKAFLIFQDIELFYILGYVNPEKIPYISGNQTFLYFRKILIFQEITVLAQKIKKPTLKKFLIYFRKSNFQDTSLENFLYLRR